MASAMLPGRFANQKIRRAHQLMNFFRETDDVYRQLPIVRAQFPASSSFRPQIKISCNGSPAASSFP